ncbi:MAG: hypothetical protein N0E48_19230 [Candidatus Thiodiazotropha endolucinida]|nr:hypothetical protein [Candidatus Thiodiazotropha endolucinida]
MRSVSNLRWFLLVVEDAWNMSGRVHPQNLLVAFSYWTLLVQFTHGLLSAGGGSPGTLTRRWDLPVAHRLP